MSSGASGDGDQGDENEFSGNPGLALGRGGLNGNPGLALGHQKERNGKGSSKEKRRGKRQAMWVQSMCV